MKRICLLSFIFLACLSFLHGYFVIHKSSRYKINRLILQDIKNPKDIEIEGDEYTSDATETAMKNARNCVANGLSPGAGLSSADEQAGLCISGLDTR